MVMNGGRKGSSSLFESTILLISENTAFLFSSALFTFLDSLSCFFAASFAFLDYFNDFLPPPGEEPNPTADLGLFGVLLV